MKERRKVYFYQTDDDPLPRQGYNPDEGLPDEVQTYEGVPYHPTSHGKEDCTTEHLYTEQKVCTKFVIVKLRCNNCRRAITEEFIKGYDDDCGSYHDFQTHYLQFGEEETSLGLWAADGDEG